MALYLRPGMFSGGASPVVILPPFFGDPNARFTSIDTSRGINLSRTSGSVPAFVQVSASQILASGMVVDFYGNVVSASSLRPYERLEYHWSFGDPNGTEIFTNPVTGLTVNTNSDQYGPEACYVYRSVGTYVITLTIRGISVDGVSYVVGRCASNFTANLFSGTDYYFDSINGSDVNSGLAPTLPKANIWGTTPAISSNGAVSSNVRINLAYGSSWSEPGTVLSFGVASNVRVQAYQNVLPPSSGKPKLISTGNAPNGTISMQSGPFTDIVLSYLDVELAPTITIAANVIGLSRSGNASVMIFNGSISGTALSGTTSPSVIKGLNQAVNGASLFDNTGALQANTIITNNLLTTVTPSQNVATEVMAAVNPGALSLSSGGCCVFTGSITSNVLTLSVIAGLSANFVAGKNLVDLTGNVGNRSLVSQIDATHWTVSAGSDVASELMLVGQAGNLVQDVYFDNLTIANNSTPANGIAVTNVTDNGSGFIRVSVASTSIFVVGNQYCISGVLGAVQANNTGAKVTSIGTGYIDLSTPSTGLGTYMGGGTVNAGGGGISLYPGGTNVFGAKTGCQRQVIYGCTVTAMTGNSASSADFGALQWMSWIGSTFNGLGGNTLLVHHVNPEDTANFGLMRWCTIGSSGVVPSQMNYCFQPRSNNFYNGTLNGDYVGGNFLVADSVMQNGTNGIGFANESNSNPSTTDGYYTSVVVERCKLGPINSAIIALTGTINFTLRDSQLWGASGCFSPSSGTGAAGSLAPYLQACVYRNSMYRPSTVTQSGITTSVEQPGADLIGLFPNNAHVLSPQEFTYNIMWDNRPGGAKPPVLQACVFSDQASVGSIFNHNQYYAPGGANYMFNGGTGQTLSIWMAAGGGVGVTNLDPDAVYARPPWANPDNGQF